MFNIVKFGRFLSQLRKNADMTQTELADKLNLTRQAVSKYEVGESFPDISVLVLIADEFGITLDELIRSGEPSEGERVILSGIAKGEENLDINGKIEDVVNLAPYIKPSVLSKLTKSLDKQGIDISGLAELIEYLNDDGVINMIESSDDRELDIGLVEKLLPILDEGAKSTMFAKIIDGELDWHYIGILLPYADFIRPQIEAAVLDGAFPAEALNYTGEGYSKYKKAEA